MPQAQARSAAFFGKSYFHGAGAGRQGTVLAFPSPGENDALVWSHFQVGSPDDVARVDLDPVDTSRARGQGGLDPLPADELIRVGEKRKNSLRFGLDEDEMF